MWVLILTFYTHIIHFVSPHRCYLSGDYCLKTPFFSPKSKWKPFIPADWYVLTLFYQSAGNVPHIFMTLWRFKNRFSQANTRTRGEGANVAATWIYALLIWASSVVCENIKLHQTVCVTYACWHAWWTGGMWTVAKKNSSLFSGKRWASFGTKDTYYKVLHLFFTLLHCVVSICDPK